MTLDLASDRQRLPLSLSVVAITTAVLMALALGLQTLNNLREDQGHNALRLGHAMADVLVQALRHNDVWLAYSLVRGPEQDVPDAIWLVVDDTQRVFASNRPQRYRLDQPLTEALPWLPIPDSPATSDGPHYLSLPTAQTDGTRRVLRLPLSSDGAAVGELIALLSDAPFLSRFREILLGGILVTGGVLMVLLPLGWVWGRRMAAPLAQLAACMARVGKEDPRHLQCEVPTGQGETGQLGRQFVAMLAALAEKEALEGQMLQAERLAAVGRVAAGVAHEVNNPLGGMLMAIDTYRRAHPVDERTARLLDLLDRALQQIQGAMSALLVEARADTRTLTPQDLEDVKTLAQPRLARSNVPLTWHLAFNAPTSLPATPVRQLLLNLLLNAIQAAQDGGSVEVNCSTVGNSLWIQIENTGQPIPPDQLAHLFEPYPATRPHGRGLGLWVCYQIVSQLGGTIGVHAEGRVTRFQVSLPLAIGGTA